MPLHGIIEPKVFEMFLGAYRGFNTSLKSLASLSNVEIWQSDEWVSLMEEPRWSTILKLWKHQNWSVDKKINPQKRENSNSIL